MLKHYSCSVSLHHLASDLPYSSEFEATATLYQNDWQRFHLVLTEPAAMRAIAPVQFPLGATATTTLTIPRLLWLELSPSRVSLTTQGNSPFSYRHLWDRGLYGISRYWLQEEITSPSRLFCLRNYTRSLMMQGSPLPRFVRVEYELWADQVRLGDYVLNLEIFSDCHAIG